MTKSFQLNSLIRIK